MEAGSKFTAGRGDLRIRLMARCVLGLRNRLRPLLIALLFDSPFYRNRVREVTGRAGFAGIVCGLWAARRVCWLTQGKFSGYMARPRSRRDPKAG
jgi:hypothetical protein